MGGSLEHKKETGFYSKCPTDLRGDRAGQCLGEWGEKGHGHRTNIAPSLAGHAPHRSMGWGVSHLGSGWVLGLCDRPTDRGTLLTHSESKQSKSAFVFLIKFQQAASFNGIQLSGHQLPGNRGAGRQPEIKEVGEAEYHERFERFLL